jgi:hypothetical protein
MQDRPTAVELLKAAQEFCERDLQPALTGRVRFHARVLQNVLGIVQRELEGEEDALRNEWARLEELFGTQDGPPDTLRELSARVKEMNRDLAGKIRDGTFDDDWDRLIERLSATTAEKLAIANPRYSRPRT